MVTPMSSSEKILFPAIPLTERTKTTPLDSQLSRLSCKKMQLLSDIECAEGSKDVETTSVSIGSRNVFDVKKQGVETHRKLKHLRKDLAHIAKKQYLLSLQSSLPPIFESLPEVSEKRQQELVTSFEEHCRLEDERADLCLHKKSESDLREIFQREFIGEFPGHSPLRVLLEQIDDKMRALYSRIRALSLQPEEEIDIEGDSLPPPKTMSSFLLLKKGESPTYVLQCAKVSRALLVGDKRKVCHFLFQCVRKNDIDSMRQILQGHKEININSLVHHGQTLLTYAFHKNRKEVIKVLCELGANPNLMDHKEVTPALLAMCKGDFSMIDLFRYHVGDLILTESLFHIKKIGHFFTLEGQIPLMSGPEEATTVRLEGSFSLFGTYLLRQCAGKWMSQLPPDLLTEEEKGMLSTTLGYAFPFRESSTLSEQEIVQRIQAGKPFFMLSGSVDHAVGLIFFQNQLLVCNRGEGMREHAIETYRYDSSLLTQKIISKLMREEFSHINRLYKFLERSGFLVEENAFVHFAQAKQKVGNCVWANTKSAFHALLFIVLEKRSGLTQAQRRTMSDALYKMFSSHTRDSALSEYLSFPYLSLPLLELICSKIQSPSFHYFSEETKHAYLHEIEKVRERERLIGSPPVVPSRAQ